MNESRNSSKNKRPSPVEIVAKHCGIKPPTPPKRRNMKNLEIPIKDATWPTLTASFPMTESAWDDMMTLLKAMKPGLVKSDDDEQTKAEDQAG